MDTTDLLNVEVIGQRGGLRRIRRWWRGAKPDKGIITQGWTGCETVEETDALPLRLFTVLSRSPVKTERGSPRRRSAS
jgi:hypothetical protein